VLDIPGVAIGHATDHDARTGCTVILFERPALTAVEVRGAAPGTRELDLLSPGRMVQRADAILLTGGAAFGLGAADGVVRALAEAGRGFPTAAGPVPIVPAAVIFDLAVGIAHAPDAAFGLTALENAGSITASAEGPVGAGCGASWGTILGAEYRRQGGIGLAQQSVGPDLVTAIAVVNAWGVVRPRVDTSVDPRMEFLETGITSSRDHLAPGTATTLIVVVTTVACNHDALIRCCVAAHDGMSRVVVPAHTLVDGDVAFAAAMNEGPITPNDLMRLTLATELAVESAIVRATMVGHATAS
jgi:L-aminopeptidase/D-esterase-like protein